MCVRRSLSSPRFWLAFILVFSFLALSPLRLTAQSTTSEQPRPDTKPKSVLVWPSDLLTLYLKIRSLQDSSATLADQVTTLQSQLNASEQIQQALSSSLGDSLTRLASLDQAAKVREALDQKAIDQARGQLLIWGAGGIVVGIVLTAVAEAVFHR